MRRGPKLSGDNREALKAIGAIRTKRRRQKPIVQGKQVRAPRWLSDAAKREWRPLAKKLATLGLLSKETGMFWGLFAEKWSDFLGVQRRLTQAIGDGGSGSLFGKTETPQSVLKLQRLTRLKNDLARDLMRALQDAGLSPADFHIRADKSDSLQARFFGNAKDRQKKPATKKPAKKPAKKPKPKPAGLALSRDILKEMCELPTIIVDGMPCSDGRYMPELTEEKLLKLNAEIEADGDEDEDDVEGVADGDLADADDDLDGLADIDDDDDGDDPPDLAA
jgi:phage terminase small subunit